MDSASLTGLNVLMPCPALLRRCAYLLLAVLGVALRAQGVAPVITTQPQGAAVAWGDPVIFSVIASGSPALTYQWYKNGVQISGATTSTLIVTDVTIPATGTPDPVYYVHVQNGVGSVDSQFVILSVSQRTQTISFDAAPAAAQPAGSAVKLSASASSGLPVTFSLVSGSGNLSGSTLTGLSATVVVRASQAGNTIYSAAADVDRTFTFYSGGVAPFLLTAPADQTVNAGASVTFGASGIGNPALAWQWSKDGAPISGATASTLALASVALGDAGRYTVTATNAVGSVTASATLTVRSAPVIASGPPDQHVAAGAPFTLVVSAAASPAPTYQWRKDGTAIAGATTASYAVGSAHTADAGVYTVVVTNALGSASSAAAQVIVDVRDFSGFYFGHASGATGDFALYVRPDNTAVFVSYLAAPGAGLVALNLTLDGSGNFSATVPVTALASTVPASATLRGTVDDGAGTVSGTITALSATFGGTRSARTGPAAAQAGFYTGALVGSDAGRGYVFVGADGRAYLYAAATATTAEGASVTVGSNGRITFSTTNQTAVDLGFAGGSFTGTVKPAGGTSVAFDGATDGVAGTQHLSNLSVRAATTPGAGTLIMGFVTTGAASKQVLIRAAGPAIAVAPFNLAGALADPSIELYRGSTLIGQNDNWGTPAASGSAIAAAATSVGAFAYRSGSADAALLTTLTPAAYTVPVGGGTGVVVTEIYEVPVAGETPGSRRLANLSARGPVTAATPLIAGFTITGSAPQRVLIRGVGATLAAAPFNLPGALANPTLTLFRNGTAIKTNDDWFRDPDAALIATTAAQVGAFALGAQSPDAAILIWLDPGSYTAQVTAATNPGVNAVALVEVYEAP